MNAHLDHRLVVDLRPLWKPTREEQKAAIEVLLCSGLDRDTRAVVRDIEEKLAEMNDDTDRD